MLFNSLVFLFAFLPVTYLVFWRLKSAQSRYVWLTVTGYVFYGYWDARFCLLMAFSTLVSYVAGLGFLYFRQEFHRRLFLVVPITVDLCLLGFFKYAGFLLDNLHWTSQAAGYEWQKPALEIVLPVGISFYTFHTISYIVDSYRRVVKPTTNLFEFAAYVSLFSQLVAGPIVRFKQIEADLEALGHTRRTRWLAKGVAFFLWGLVEKVMLADSLAAWVDPSLQRYSSLSTTSTWLVMLAYSFQLYFDFCGYSDMAVGLGFMFGLRIPQNFNSPYKALDPSDFWKRWHISLSTCMRDYLYIPFGGNRYGPLVTDRNLLLTMLIGGLWHGANWTFVIWGLYHGLLLITHRHLAVSWASLPARLRQGATFFLVLIGWVWFRSVDVQMANALFSKMFFATSGETLGGLPTISAMLTLAGGWACFGPNAFDALEEYEWRPWHSILYAAVFGACVAVIAGGGNSPFLYFQF
jgi:alginate O-acetyltransferase complex protein AlgI